MTNPVSHHFIIATHFVISIYIFSIFGCYRNIISFDVNNVIWLADPPGAALVILENLGYYFDVTNVSICQRQNQTVP
jgi:hypothetical protein